jgi:hypothetical protein
MVQSDTLSRQPDYGTDERMEEEDKVVLPDNLFINLLDTELQERILNEKEFDLDVKNTIETLMEEGPTSLKMTFKTGKLKILMDKKRYSLKERIIYRKIWNFNETLCYNFELYAISSLYSRSVLSKI